MVLETVDGIDANEWAPRDLRHTFVSLLSDNGVLIEEIARLLGHAKRFDGHREGLPPAAAAGR